MPRKTLAREGRSLMSNEKVGRRSFLRGAAAAAVAGPYVLTSQALGGPAKAVRAYGLSSRFDDATPTPPVEYAFEILDNVAQKDGSTVWSIVYDYGDSRIYFKTAEAPEIKYFDTSAFDYSDETPVRILDMNAELSGDVTEGFVDYTYEANRELIGVVFSSVDFLKEVPEESLEAIARYPEETEGE